MPHNVLDTASKLSINRSHVPFQTVYIVLIGERTGFGGETFAIDICCTCINAERFNLLALIQRLCFNEINAAA